IRFKIDGLLLVLFRLFKVADFGIGRPQNGDVAALSPLDEFARLLGMFDGLYAIAVLGIGTASQIIVQVFVKSAALGINPNGLVKVGYRLVVLVLRGQDMTAVVEGVSIVGFKPQLFVEIGQREVEVSFCKPGETSIPKRFSFLRIVSQDFVEVGNRAVVI